MRESYSGILALDGSVLIGLAIGEEGFSKLKSALINESAVGLTHELAITELIYVLCRKTSMKTALEKLNYLKLSEYITIIPLSEIIEVAAEIKCQRSLAIADCFTLALAKRYGGKAVFARAEKELLREVSGESFDTDIIFVMDNKIVKRNEKSLKSIN